MQCISPSISTQSSTSAHPPHPHLLRCLLLRHIMAMRSYQIFASVVLILSCRPSTGTTCTTQITAINCR